MRVKLLITSVGSMVGKNILDVLEFPGWSRRALVHVVGTNSVADAPTNFRCDRCYLVPETRAADHQARIRDILLEESPDLILCGRDEDTRALSELRARYPGLPGTLPVGEPQSTLIGLDKWETWQFCLRHGLPGAESFMPGGAGDGAVLETFCNRVGYPIVAKPVRGFASRGIYFLQHARDVQLMAQRDGYLFQEYLGDPQALEPYFAALRGPAPLAVHAPEAGQYSCQTVIAPDGNFAQILVVFIVIEHGDARTITRVSDPSLDALGLACARALAREGARGPANMQFRRDRHGNWKLTEINLRNTGSTLARFLLGMDELYLIVRSFMPGASFPELHPSGSDRVHRAGKYLDTYCLSDRAVGKLQEAGVWSR